MSKWVIWLDDILLIENIFHMSGEIFKRDVFFSFQTGRFRDYTFTAQGSSTMDKIIVESRKERLQGKIRCLYPQP